MVLKTGNETWTKLLLLYILCLLRSTFIPLSFSIVRRIYDNPDYSSANCLMKLVNETSPKHFESHIFYKHLEFDYDCDIESYVQAQYSHGEYLVLQYYFVLLALSAVVAALIDWKNFLSLSTVGTLFAGYHLSQIHHVFSHYGQDISFFAGNVLHHADISGFIDKSNASLVDTVPQGFTLTIIVSITWASLIRSLIPILDPDIGKHISWKSLYFCNVLFGFVVGRQVQKDHPWLHEYATPEMSKALPFTWDFTAYQHVYGHHVSGEWLGPHVILDPIFSIVMRFYAFLHNDILHLHVNSVEHYILTVMYDSLVSFLVVFLIWGVLRGIAAVQMSVHLAWRKQRNRGKED